MNPDHRAKIDRRRLLTSLAAGAGLTHLPSLISCAACAAPGIYRFSSPDHAVIVTSAGLIATDQAPPHVDELARRLDHALAQPKVVDHIARTQSRFFALSSVTLDDPPDLILDFQTTLDRQSKFVSRNFGPLALDDLPVYSVTSIDEDNGDVLAPVLDVLNYITNKSGFWPGAKFTRARDIFFMTDAMRTPGKLDLITLWPCSQIYGSMPIQSA